MSKTVLDKHKLVSELAAHDVPFHVWSLFGDKQRQIQLLGTDICLGEDYATLKGCRQAIEWYVEQLGGTVKWNANE